MKSTICPECGAALDATERCDCRRNPYHGRPYKPGPVKRPKAPPPELVYDAELGIWKAIIWARK